MRRLIALVVLVLVGGCFNPKFKDGLKCSSKNTCPPGFGCEPANHVCLRNFVPDAAADGPASDRGAEASPEAPPKDATSGDADATADVMTPDVTTPLDATDTADATDGGAAADGGDAADAKSDVSEGGPADVPADKLPEAAVEAGVDLGIEVGPPPPGLIGRWALGDEYMHNETVPDLATADGTQNGTIFDNGDYMRPVKDRNGVANRAVAITADDEVSDAFAYIHTGITTLPASGVTISAWIAQQPSNGTGLIAGINHGPQLWHDSYRVSVRMGTDSFNYGKAQGSSLTDGQWVHATAVISPSGPSNWKLEIYVNGALVNSATVANNNVPTQGTFNIGGMYNCSGQGCGDGFKGHLDDVRLYNKALSATEVQALYNAPTN